MALTKVIGAGAEGLTVLSSTSLTVLQMVHTQALMVM